jgi:3-hydroxyisobutyrate dehydrogenase-like beta-hydroxyacid dehydrogenase
MMTTIGLLHPGEMGTSVGGAGRAGGARVPWTSQGRSASTRTRAAADGLEDAGTLAALVAASDVILAVCPPDAATDVARAVTSLGFTGTYVDANAVSPATAREIGTIVEKAGATYVDGGIIGPPARSHGTTRLYLSGQAAPGVAALFEGTPLEAIVVVGGAGAASAVKMAYAAWTKGSAALLLAVRALASAEGAEAALLAEWKRSQPDLPGRSEAAARGNSRKAWRFVGEMDEIAATFAGAGLPDGFHRAAGEIYRRMERYKDAPPPPVEELARTLLERPQSGGRAAG